MAPEGISKKGPAVWAQQAFVALFLAGTTAPGVTGEFDSLVPIADTQYMTTAAPVTSSLMVSQPLGYINDAQQAMTTVAPAISSQFPVQSLGVMPYTTPLPPYDVAGDQMIVLPSPQLIPVHHHRRLHITNQCKEAPIWIAHAGDGIPDPQNIRIDPLETHKFATPNRLSAVRYWPKMGCDSHGENCVLGTEAGGAPPVDTKFEATFGSNKDRCDMTNESGCDFVDVSLVDGFTLPFEMDMKGRCFMGRTRISCAGLSLDQCPRGEPLLEANLTADLNMVHPKTSTVAGCFSPCSKLIMSGLWGGSERDVLQPGVVPYCCPTPPESPQNCSTGPVSYTAYVNLVHAACPGVYAYAYDDAQGLAKCDANTIYHLSFFCPANISHWGQPTARLLRPQPQRPRQGPRWHVLAPPFPWLFGASVAAVLVYVFRYGLSTSGWRQLYQGDQPRASEVVALTRSAASVEAPAATGQ